MNRKTLRIVLFVSCAHLLVHVFELSLPSVEQEIDAEFQCGTKTTGLLGTCWRVPWGVGAILAGILVDRFGSRIMLTIYLLGCAVTCVIAALTTELNGLFLAMVGMGTCAAIYHPAGLALISRTTTEENRPLALGIHGIFGSLGIGGAPFIAGLILMIGMGWRSLYWLLVLPALVLGIIFACSQRTQHTRHEHHHKPSANDDSADWISFGALVVVAILAGTTYSAFLHFLPRYLSGSSIEFTAPLAGQEQLLTGGLLLLGCFGQYLAGTLARHKLLEWQLTIVMFLNIPCLVAMGIASGWLCAAAAGTFSIVHFMQQPIYNSLVAKYTPLSRRSLCYGFSFTMGLGLGGIGPLVVGYSSNNFVTYVGLAGATTTGTVISLLLALRNRSFNR